jgi:hypothetical protein
LGALVQLYRNSTDEIVGSGTTDEEGFYTVQYKHKGKADLYTVILVGENAQLISLRGNGWAEVSFDVDTGATEAIWAGSGGGGGKRWK